MSMEPSPQTQAAFMEADQWFLNNVVLRAHHWLPAVATFVAAALVLRPWDLFDAASLAVLWWVLVNSNERDAVLRHVWAWIASMRPANQAPPPIIATAPRTLLAADKQTRPNNPIKALGNFLEFGAGVLGFAVRHWRALLVLALVLIGWFFLRDFRLPFGIGESREEVRVERDQAVERSRVVTKLSRSGYQTGEEYREKREIIVREVEIAREQIQDYQHEDALGLLTVWRDADRRLCDLALSPG